MRVALVFCPYLTNGDMPPLGLSSINGALRQAGHETVPLDLAWRAYRHEWPFLHHLRQVANIGQSGRNVAFVLAPQLLLGHVFGPEVLGSALERLLSPNPVRRHAELASLRLVRLAVGRWLQVIAAARPEAVFFSAYISNLMVTLPLAMAVKRELGVPVVLGGPGVGLAEVQDLVLRLPADPALPPESGRAVDAIVVREGEETVVEVAARLAPGAAGAPLAARVWSAALADVPGVAVLDEDGRLHARERPFARSLDELPRASFVGLPLPSVPLAGYGDPREHAFASHLFYGSPLAATRGCVNHCAYCSESAYWQRFRQRSVASVIDELDQRHAELGVTGFLFCDSALNGNRAWLGDFCAAVASRGYTFFGYAIAARGTDAELSTAMARAGFQGLTLGVETFCERTLASVSKHLSRADVDAALSAFTGAGLPLTVHVLAGFPGETEADHEESARGLAEWVKRDRAKLIRWNAAYPVRLEPHSPFWHQRERFGISVRPYSIDLPAALEYLAAPLSRLTFTWDAGLSVAEVERRCARLRAIAGGESPGSGAPLSRGAAVSPILRSCLRLVAELGVDGPCRRDLVAVLEEHADEWLTVWQHVGYEAGLAREELLWRGVAVHFLGTALDLCDDMVAGRVTNVPAADAVLTLLHLPNGLMHALARSAVSAEGVVRATRLLGEAAYRAHDVPAGDDPTAACSGARARAAGSRLAACLRILWDGSPLETEAEPTGAALGFAAFVVRDLRRCDRAQAGLPDAALQRLLDEAATAAGSVESGSACAALRDLAQRHRGALREAGACGAARACG